MPMEGLGFFSEPPQCAPLDLGNDYLSMAFSGDILSGVQTALDAVPLDPRYLNALQDAMFFCQLKKFVIYDALINKWMFHVANNIATVVMACAVTFVTLWVVTTGMKIMSGMHREPFSLVILQGAKFVFVLSLVAALTKNADTVIHTVLGLQTYITQIITGSSLTVEKLVDMNLAVGQFANMVAEDITDSVADQSSKRGSFNFFVGAMGQAGPAVFTSMLVMLSQIAIAISLMLAPLFFFFLLFKGTTSLFWGWIKFLFSTFLALCFVAIVSTITMSATLGYGLLIGLSQLLNHIADGGGASGTAAEIGIGVLTGNAVSGTVSALTGGDAGRVDLSGTTTNLAAMGAMFSIIIVATPALIMQLFNASLGYASNLMGAMGVPRAGVGQNQGQGQQGGGAPALGNNAAGSRAGGDEISVSEQTRRDVARISGSQQSNDFRPGPSFANAHGNNSTTVAIPPPKALQVSGEVGSSVGANHGTTAGTKGAVYASGTSQEGAGTPAYPSNSLTTSVQSDSATSANGPSASAAREATLASRNTLNSNARATDIEPKSETYTSNTATAAMLAQQRSQDVGQRFNTGQRPDMRLRPEIQQWQNAKKSASD